MEGAPSDQIWDHSNFKVKFDSNIFEPLWCLWARTISIYQVYVSIDYTDID